MVSPAKRARSSRKPGSACATAKRSRSSEEFFKSSETYDLQAFLMRSSGLEPPRTIRSTRPSTLRVYQFRHERRAGEYIPAPGSLPLPRLHPVHSPRYCTNTCSFKDSIHPTREPRTHGSDQAPAGDIRLYRQVFG